MKFYTKGLLSKWGFGDGDCLDEFLWDNDVNLSPIGIHELLFNVVKQHVLPDIQNEIDLGFVHTIHNPVRAVRVDGELIESHTENRNDVTIEPAVVEVDDSIILEMARQQE